MGANTGDNARKTLWLGSLPRNYELGRDIPFSLMSFSSRDADGIETAEALGLFVSAIGSRRERRAADAMLRRAYWSVFIPEFASRFPGMFPAPNSEMLWSIVHAPWLMFLLQVSWVNYQMLCKLGIHYQGQKLRVVAPEAGPYFKRPRDSHGLIRLIRNVDFHAWTAAQWLPHIASDKWSIDYYRPSQLDEKHDAQSDSVTWKSSIKLALTGRCKAGELSLLWRLVFSQFLAAKRIPKAAIGGSDANVCIRARSEEEDRSDGPDPVFCNVARGIVGHCTPVFYGDEFQQNFERLKRCRYRRGYGRMVSSDTYSDGSNLAKAIAVSRGEIVYSSQHGGGYGVHEVYPLSPDSEYLGGPFITWGWKHHEDYFLNALPLPSPALSQLKARRGRARVGRSVVFVGADMSPLVARIQSKPLGPEWLDYRREKVAFLTELSSDVFDTILYRGYESGDVLDGKHLAQIFPRLRQCEEQYRTFHHHLVSSRLCVVDHPITTLHQSMAMNIPTLAFWNPSHWELSRQSLPYFDGLRKVGILYPSGSQAGKALQERFGSIEDWWWSADVQHARREWCSRYAKTSRTWPIEWIRAIWFGPGQRTGACA